MKIIFADNDYYMMFILSGQDTLESRRALLTERFFRRSVLREAPIACTICCRKNEIQQWQTVCATLRLLNTSQPELINFGILLSPIACGITISLGSIVLYWFLQRVSITCYAERCTSYSKSVRLSVCMSVRLPHADTLSKQLQLRSCSLHWRLAPRL